MSNAARIEAIMQAAPAVSNLPVAPLLERWWLESPWMLMGALGLLGVVGFLALSRRGRSREAAGAVILGLVLAAMVFSVAAMLTTPREGLQRLTRETIAAAAAADTGRLAEVLDAQARVMVLSGAPAVGGGREAILDAVREYPGSRYPIREHSMSAVQAVVDGPNTARTQVRVWVRLNKEQAFYDVPIGSWWRLSWRRDPLGGAGAWGPWRITSIEMLQLDGFGAGGR